MVRLNLGCGNVLSYGSVNVDIHPLSRGARRILEMDDGTTSFILADARSLPFRDDTFGHIKAFHVLEHIEDLVGAMAEIHRIAKPLGTVELAVPYYRHDSAFSDPTHVHFFTEYSFDYWALNGLKYGHSYQSKPKEAFEIEAMEKEYLGRFLWLTEHRIPARLRPLARRILKHQVATLRFRLTAIKPGVRA